jgi:hypothetical protein
MSVEFVGFASGVLVSAAVMASFIYWRGRKSLKAIATI